jgi:protein TonB
MRHDMRERLLMEKAGLRAGLAALVAAGVTFGLFLAMHKLISLGNDDRVEQDAIAGIHFGPVEIPDEVLTRSRRRLPRPLPPKDPPPPPKMQVSKIERQMQDLPRIDIPDIDLPLVAGTGMLIGNFKLSDQAAEGEIIPVVVIRPMYPREAAMSGTEGWVKVEFTITTAGTVKDPHVIESDPPRVFDREAIRAILKWKFKPRVVNGIAVERRATQVIDFSLDKS